MDKLTDKYFRDWENSVFGYGYGSGEEPIMKALMKFFETMKASQPEYPNHKSYDFEKLEKELGESTTWLLINVLCHADILEYGTSPRYGWLTDKGQILEQYLREKELEGVLNVLFRDGDELHDYCTKDYCNCGDEHVNNKCKNPLY